MLKNKIIPFLFLLLAAGNRAVSQSFSIGGLYYYEFLIALAATIKPRSVFRELKRNIPAVAFIAYAIMVLAIELALHGANPLIFRRAALGIYALTPIIMLAYHSEIKSWIAKNYNFFIAITLFFSITQLGGFQATMAAQLVGSLAFFEAVNRGLNRRSILLFSTYIVLVSGVLTGQSMYRAPILTILIAAPIALWLSSAKPRLKRKHLIYLSSAFFFTVAIAISGVLNKPVGGLLLGISGATNSTSLRDAGISLGAEISSTRGDASGTAKTRIIFWESIMEYQANNTKSLIFGYGLQHGFMEVTLPHMPFIDKQLTDPHNSFMNIFFRFGMVGLFLYAGLIFTTYRSIARRTQNPAPYLIISLIFASTEVALENPHGNLIFWLIILLPSLLPSSATNGLGFFASEKKIENTFRS